MEGEEVDEIEDREEVAQVFLAFGIAVSFLPLPSLFVVVSVARSSSVVVVLVVVAVVVVTSSIPSTGGGGTRASLGSAIFFPFVFLSGSENNSTLLSHSPTHPPKRVPQDLLGRVVLCFVPPTPLSNERKDRQTLHIPL